MRKLGLIVTLLFLHTNAGAETKTFHEIFSAQAEERVDFFIDQSLGQILLHSKFIDGLESASDSPKESDQYGFEKKARWRGREQKFSAGADFFKQFRLGVSTTLYTATHDNQTLETAEGGRCSLFGGFVFSNRFGNLATTYGLVRGIEAWRTDREARRFSVQGSSLGMNMEHYLAPKIAVTISYHKDILTLNSRNKKDYLNRAEVWSESFTAGLRFFIP